MKTLQQVLAQCTKEQLEQIARLWGFVNPPEGGWIDHRDRLAQAMQDPIAARFVWEHLSLNERKVLYEVFGYHISNWIEPDTLSSLTRLPESAFEVALSSLKQHMLLLEEQTSARNEELVSTRMYAYRRSQLPSTEITILYIPKEIANLLYITGNEIFSPQHDRSAMALEVLLARLSPTKLQEVGQHYDIDMKSKIKNLNPVQPLMKKLLRPETPSFALKQIDPAIRDLFTWLCDQGGKMSMQEVRRHTGYNDAALAAALHTLEEYALAFDTFSGQERLLFVPYEIYLNWRKVTAQSEGPTKLISLDSPPQTVLPAEPLSLYDLALLIGATYHQNLEPTKTAMVSKRIASKLQPMLRGRPRYVYASTFGDYENHYIDMLLHEAYSLGLLTFSQPAISGSKELLKPGPQLERWARMNTAEQTQHLLQHWLKSNEWADLSGANYVPESFYFFNIVPGRSVLLSYLRECSPGRWYTVSSLIRKIREENPFALRSADRSLGWAGDRRSSEILAKWDNCDGQKFIGMLSSSLYELGIVALGYQRSHLPETDEVVNPDAFMLTELGATVLSSQAKASLANYATPASNGNRILVVQPNFELLLMELNLPLVYSLLPFAEVEQVGRVSRLILTRQSILRAIDAGMSGEQILQLLEERAQKEVPQNVAYTLRDWAKLYKKVTVSQVVLLEVTSEELANEICTSSKLKAFGLRRIGPCVIAAGGGINPQELRRTLEKMGIAAHISGEILTPQNRI